jgi:glycine hydroxymethyltransferase
MIGKDRENPWGKFAPKSGRIKNISELIDSMVMPGIQGGPLMHIISAKAVAFGEALHPSFKHYSSQIIKNAKCIAEEMMKRNYNVISGGTDTHLVLIDLTKKDVSGKQAEQSLEKAGITINKNMVPFDKRSPFVTSGIRIGTSAITTRGMKTDQMKIIAEMIDTIVNNHDDEKKINKIRDKVRELSSDFPLYPELFAT